MKAKNRSVQTVLPMLVAVAGNGLALASDPTSPTTQKGAASELKRVTSRDGASIAFEEAGSGPPLILVSGALSSRASGTRLAALLAPHFTVINYDRRGRGDSGDTQPYAVQREVEDIEALVDHAGGSAFLFGSSSGAALALEAARCLPAKVKKAVLFEPPFIVDDSRPPVPDDFTSQLQQMVAAGRRGDAVEFFMTTGVGLPAELVAQMRAGPAWPQMELLAHTLPYDGAIVGDLLLGKPLPADRWTTAASPILVVDGALSDAWLRNSAKSLAEALPNARHHTIDGQDHSGPFRAPQVFVPVLVEFFVGPDAGP